MGTSITGYLTPTQIAQTQAYQAAMVSAGSSLPPPTRPFVFLAAFDGTNNDRNNVPLSGSLYQTNVANIYDQAKENEANNFVPRYYPGVGTGGENGGLLQAALSPTQAVHFAAEKALADFADRAYRYLRDNPSATYADLSASAVGFSRGGITAIVFARLLNERGLVLPDGTVVAPPGVAVYGLAPIDPVKSGIEGDLSIPPNVKGDALVIRSVYEDRNHFESADLSADPRAVIVEVYNNHVGSGGGDDKNGTAASVLEGVTGYLQKQGAAIAEVSPDMRFDPSQPVAIRSEAYQTAANGDLLTNEDGTPRLRWPVAGTPDTRETVPIPATEDTHDPRDPHSVDAVNGSDLQSDQYTPPGQQASSDFEQALLDAFQNPQLPTGPGTQYADAGSNTATDAGGASGTAQDSQPNQPTADPASAADYVNGSDLQSDLATAESMTQLQAAAALGLVNTIIGLQNWSAQSDLSHLSTAIGLYNQLNHISGGALGSSTGLGNLGQLGAGLGFLSALESGNVGGIVANGVALGNAVFDGAVSNAIGSALGIQAGNVVPGIGLLIALDSGDPLSVVSAALAFIPGWGQAAAIFLSIAGSMFESDIPMKEGQAHAQWDAQGNTIVITDQDIEGGGATATGWMNSIVAGLQAQLAATQDAAGNSYALIPNLLPAIGYQYDADGMNYGSAPGHMYLQWVDATGNTQTRYYDGAGNREDGTGETLAGDFMAKAQGAIAPAWQVATVLAHWQNSRVSEGGGTEIKAPNQVLAKVIRVRGAIDFVANDGVWRKAA